MSVDHFVALTNSDEEPTSEEATHRARLYCLEKSHFPRLKSLAQVVPIPDALNGAGAAGKGTG